MTRLLARWGAILAVLATALAPLPPVAAGAQVALGQTAYAQVFRGAPRPPRSGFNTNLTPATSYDAAVTNYCAAGGGCDSTHLPLIAALIQGLEADGVWSKLDWFVILANQSEALALTNAVVPSKSLSKVNSPTFTVDRGYQGDAATKYLSYNEALNAGSNHYSQNASSMGVWWNIRATGGVSQLMGSLGDNNVNVANNAPNNMISRQSATTGVSAVTTDTTDHHYTGVRTTSTAVRVFASGAFLATNTSNNSTAITSTAGEILGARGAFSDARIAAAYSGGTLTDADVAEIHSRLSTYLTAVGGQ